MKTLKVPALIAALALLFLSCEVTVTNIQTYDVSGTAVNVQADKTDSTWASALSGAVVTLTDTESGSVRTATVSSSGTFGWDGLPVGEYRMTAVKTGWAFVPRVIELTGKTLVLPDLLGYEYDNDTIYLIAEWENEDVDVDASLVIDDDENYTTSFDGSDALDIVDRTDTTYTGVSFDRDITPLDIAGGLPAVETISISSNPFTDFSGFLKFYLSATKEGELTGDSAADILDARATVHVMQGTVHFGSFPVATETHEDLVMMVAIFVDGDGTTTTYTISSAGNFGGLQNVK